MPLRDLFLKPVDRPIEGVIKADDEASLRLEVEEYVLTNEVAKRLESFLAAYDHPGNANGVWVSGFFGSGKSHLLKMLALTLGNRDLSGAEALELFLPKCGDNEILRAELKRAVAIPSQSVLFNIDQKADVISKGEFDAVLAVFMKVFDEMRGYYGRQGHIARFERDLDGKGKLEAFKSAFQDAAGIPWESGRETAALEADAIAEAYARATGGTTSAGQGILDKYRADYRVSIEDFASEVNAYVDEREEGFRLNFFVDEVGQYIGDNVKLMTNLQTIAESLATKCHGRAWIIVTAQEDMTTVMGESGAFQSDDFSKIQARFAIRLKLTSADVAEVIRKRLLQKNEVGIAILSDLYQDQKNNFKTLFDFADGSQSYNNFRDGEEFIHSYPFIPYQYTLFQASIQNLSKHNAFEGRHTAVGERSMLGVFQDVAKVISGHEVGHLATFDLMFEGIRTALKAQVQRSILTAEQHLGDSFAIQVLKALFLVKYVREFKATIRNLTVLLLDHFDADLPELKKRIEAALNLLESQTYIQRNGDLFEYLTDEEKDVEEYIKLTDVDAASVSEELGKMIFDGVLGSNKMRYDSNKQDFPFARKLDERLLSRDQELAIHVVSPFHEHAGSETTIRAHSMGRDELLVIMPLNERLIRDLRLYKQTDRYVRQNTTVTENDTVRRILAEKQAQNQTRKNTLTKLVSELLSQSTLVVGGQDIDLGFSEPQGRLKTAFQDLVTRSYPNLQMLRGKLYAESEIVSCLKPGSTLFEGDEGTVSEAEKEVLGHIKQNGIGGVRTTLQTLVTAFEKKPYGWHNAAILCMVAKLCARGKVELRLDGVMLEDDALERGLKNSYDHGKVIVTPQIDYQDSQIRNLKDFHADFFDGPVSGSDARSIGLETGKAFSALKAKLEGLIGQAYTYPFVESITGRVAELDEHLLRPYGYYLSDLLSAEQALFDLKEDVLDPFMGFMGGQQRKIYDDAHALLRDQAANLSHIEGNEQESISAILAEAQSYRGKRVAELSTLTVSLRAKIGDAVEACRDWAGQEIAALESRLGEVEDFGALKSEQKAEIRSAFERFGAGLATHELIAVIRQEVVTFREVRYPELLQKMSSWANPPTPDPPPGPGPQPPRPSPVEYISRSRVKVDYSKAALESEEDVDEYVAALRFALLVEIESGKRISV